MFFDEPFPKAKAWIDANRDEADRQELDEYLEAVRYHLSVGANAEREASASIRPKQWGISHDGAALYLIGFDPSHVVRYGDIAIREAATVIDVGLQFTNRALNLGIGKGDVRWGRGAKESPLRARLRKSGIEPDAALLASIDALFDSIGLNLLQGYRHWVTHRGAPRVRSDHLLGEGIPLDEEIRQETNERRKLWLIESKLLREIAPAIRIECHPFVPPVQAVINMKVEEATTDIEIPGVLHIGKGSKNIEIHDMALSTGSSMESVADFTAKNPILREESKIRLAGEDLAVYKAWDYLHALSFVTRFIGNAVRAEWDERLAVSLVNRGGKPSGGSPGN